MCRPSRKFPDGQRGPGISCICLHKHKQNVKYCRLPSSVQVGLLVLEGFLKDGLPEDAWGDSTSSERSTMPSAPGTVSVRGSAASSSFVNRPGFVRSPDCCHGLLYPCCWCDTCWWQPACPQIVVATRYPCLGTPAALAYVVGVPGVAAL